MRKCVEHSRNFFHVAFPTLTQLRHIFWREMEEGRRVYNQAWKMMYKLSGPDLLRVAARVQHNRDKLARQAETVRADITLDEFMYYTEILLCITDLLVIKMERP